MNELFKNMDDGFKVVALMILCCTGLLLGLIGGCTVTDTFPKSPRPREKPCECVEKK